MNQIIMVSINGTMYFFYSDSIIKKNLDNLKRYAISICNDSNKFLNDDEIWLFYQINVKKIFNIDLKRITILDVIRINKKTEVN